jgi:hypothetical protein
VVPFAVPGIRRSLQPATDRDLHPAPPDRSDNCCDTVVGSYFPKNGFLYKWHYPRITLPELECIDDGGPSIVVRTLAAAIVLVFIGAGYLVMFRPTDVHNRWVVIPICFFVLCFLQVALFRKQLYLDRFEGLLRIDERGVLYRKSQTRRIHQVIAKYDPNTEWGILVRTTIPTFSLCDRQGKTLWIVQSVDAHAIAQRLCRQLKLALPPDP